mgnify:CR=1 FL=1
MYWEWEYIFLIISLLFSIQISAQKSALNIDLTVKDIIKQYNDLINII